METQPSTSGYAIASLVLGLFTIILVFCCVGYITGILSIVFGCIALSKTKSDVPTSPNDKILSKVGIGISAFAMIGYAIIYSFTVAGILSTIPFGEFTKPNTKKQPPNLEIPPTKASQPAPKKEPFSPIAESCSEMSRAFGPSSKMSDLQKDETWKAYKGKHFKWDLTVREVSQDMFGGYTVQYKCTHNSPSLIQDIQIKYPESRKGFVIQLSKGDSYMITGKLGMSSSLLGMTADDLIVE